MGMHMSAPVWDEEEWRSVGRAPDYDVSNFGRIRRRTPAKGATVGARLKLKVQPKGHLYVILATSDGPKTLLVHHLVAEAFLGPRPCGLLALHRDDDKRNNTPANIYYGTYRNNISDARRNGLFTPGKRKDGMPRVSVKGRKSPNKSPTPEQVREIRRLSDTLSCVRIAAVVGVSKSTVHRVITKEIYTHVF